MSVRQHLEIHLSHLPPEELTTIGGAPVRVLEKPNEIFVWAPEEADLVDYRWEGYVTLRELLRFARWCGCDWIRLTSEAEPIPGIHCYALAEPVA
jgi:hypothetical protein